MQEIQYGFTKKIASTGLLYNANIQKNGKF